MLKFKKLLSNVSRLSRQITTTSRLASDELNVHRDSDDNDANTPFEFTEANLVVGAAYILPTIGVLSWTSTTYQHSARERIAALIQNYPEGAQRAVVGPALDIVQRQIGWVPIASMHKVAQLLSIPRVRVYEWATFYTMNKRHFRGQYHIKICATTPCMIRGADEILNAAQQACCCCVGSVSEDRLFGVDIVECAGACVNAPVMVVDDDYFEDLTPADVHNIIQTIRCGGIPQPGPQNGRFAAEPLNGLTSLLTKPPPPGFGLQSALKK